MLTRTSCARYLPRRQQLTVNRDIFSRLSSINRDRTHIESVMRACRPCVCVCVLAVNDASISGGEGGVERKREGRDLGPHDGRRLRFTPHLFWTPGYIHLSGNRCRIKGDQTSKQELCLLILRPNRLSGERAVNFQRERVQQTKTSKPQGVLYLV